MRNHKISFSLLILFFISIGLVARLIAFFDDYRLRYMLLEDGYYMITIGRNIALGHGMSIAEGLIPTNGVQPLYTYVIAGISWLVSCDKLLTVYMVVIVQVLISLSIFCLIWKIGCTLFEGNKYASQISLLAAAVWFSNPLTILHTTNGLETGFYTLTIVLFIWLVLFKIKKFNFLTSVFLGVFLGIIFLARNDGVFFIAGFCLFILFFKFYDKQKLSVNIFHAVVMGLVSVIVALPWLMYNLKFGSIMPISGHAELSSATSDPNYKYVTAVFTEYFLLFYSIPYVVKMKAIVIIGCSIFSAVILYLLFRNYKSFTPRQKQIFFIAIFFLLSLGIFYGIYFRTYYFLSRYLFPASPFICLIWAAAVFMILEKIKLNSIRYLLAGLFVIYFAFISVKNYRQDNQLTYSHFVDWVDKNVRNDQWIASYQTGILGYYHDRSINLDGKVNPYALKAIEENKMWDYIINNKPDYLIDVVSMAEWKKVDIIMQNYDLIVEDYKKNMAVFRRKGIN